MLSFVVFMRVLEDIYASPGILLAENKSSFRILLRVLRVIEYCNVLIWRK